MDESGDGVIEYEELFEAIQQYKNFKRKGAAAAGKPEHRDAKQLARL